MQLAKFGAFFSETQCSNAAVQSVEAMTELMLKNSTEQ